MASHLKMLLLALSLNSVYASFGDVFVWGRGKEGQLGLDNFDQQNFPMPVPALLGAGVRSIDAGKASSTAVTADGKVYMWGEGIDKDGFLGPGKSSDVPVLVTGFAGTDVVQFVAGNCHYAALTRTGDVLTWGCADFGATGHGTKCKGCRNDSPEQIKALRGRNIRQIVAGGDHTAALTDNGEVWVWGSGESGEIGNGGFQDIPTPVRVEKLKSVRICQICAGSDHMAAVDTEGRMYTWGQNEFGQLGHGLNEQRINEPRILQRFSYPDNIAIAACSFGFTGAITRSNKVFFWGNGGFALPTEKEFFRGKSARAITAGTHHIMVVTKEFEVYGWGSNWQGQLGVSSEGFFSRDPQLIEDLNGKRINSIATGLNHTIALSGQPMDLLCPVFQDWYTPPDAIFSKFVATCPPDGTTCPDTTCCKGHETCVKFHNQEGYGCCAGEKMKFCEDDFTCCHESAICNMRDQLCETPVSYADAARLLSRVNSGELKPIPFVPGMNPEKAANMTFAHSDLTGTHVNIPLDALSSRVEGTEISETSQHAYQHGGLIASAKAAVDEYQKLTAQQAHDLAVERAAQHEEARREAESGYASTPVETSTEYSSGSASSPSSVTGPSVSTDSTSNSASPPRKSDNSAPAPQSDEEVIATATDALFEKILNNELSAAHQTEPGSEDIKGGEALPRSELLNELQKYNHDPSFKLALEFRSNADLQAMLNELKRQFDPPAPKKTGNVIDATGSTISGPFDDSIAREEKLRALKAPSIEDLEDDEKPLKEVEVVSVDPLDTKIWRDNVKKSEKLAGRPHLRVLHEMNILRPEDPPLEPGVVPGAGELILPSSAKHYTPTEISELRARGELLQSSRPAIVAHRPGSGPCPRSAGNLDCNKDCSEVDAQVIDAARTASELADEVAKRVKATGDSDAAQVIDSFPEPLSAQDLLSPSPSPSVSPIPLRESSRMIRNSTFLIHERYADANLTVKLDSLDVEIPNSGLFSDPLTNATYKIVGDRVYLTEPAAKFTSMGGAPGSLYKGHCGESRPTCPDNSCCSEGETCCKQQDGSYGCCPFTSGTCCYDQRHCCPGGYSCDLINNQCKKGNLTMAIARFSKVDQGLCDAGQRSCKDGSCCSKDQGCCTMHDGLQGCAPYPDATCCSDGIHACPSGSTCDTIHGVCSDVATGLVTPIGTLEHTMVPPGVSLVCYPDEQTCSDGNCCNSESTCCLEKDGYQHCCPFTDGVCCGGGLCCPHGFTCDIEGQECIGPEGKTALTPTMSARAPYLVAEACAANEQSCPGTHDCCEKGHGCCLGSQKNADGEMEMTSECCPLGEDAICCETGSCCPYGSSCDTDHCIFPNGERVEKGKTQRSRKSENQATSTCVNSGQLHEEYRKIADEKAKANQIVRILVSEETPVLMCPPFCRNSGSLNPTRDTGVWATAEVANKVAEQVGEAGIHLQVPVVDSEQERERERLEMMDEAAYLKIKLARLLSLKESTTNVFQIRGSFVFDCPWTDSFRQEYGAMIQKALSNHSDIPEQHVVIKSVRPGITVDYQIESPTESDGKVGAEKLDLAIRSGQFVSTLEKLGFPSCIESMKITELPGVEQLQSLNLSDKLKLMENVQKIISKTGYQNNGDASQIMYDVESLKALASGLAEMKREVGIAEVQSVAGDILGSLGDLITLLTSYLEPLSAQDAAKSAALYQHAESELNSIFDKIKAARQATRCQRASPNDPPSPGCENTQMALSAMPLRDLDDSEKYDPQLQKQFGSSIRVPSGTDYSKDQDPPVWPHDREERKIAWMPEGCQDGNCNEH